MACNGQYLRSSNTTFMAILPLVVTNNIQSDTSKVTNSNPIIEYLSIWNPYNGKKFDSSITKKRTETFMLSYSSARTILIGGQLKITIFLHGTIHMKAYFEFTLFSGCYVF